jgi:WD40 repeat protein
VALGKTGGRPIALTGSRDQTARLWDVATGAELATLTGHTDYVNAVALGEAGGRPIALTASRDQTVRIWDAITGALLDLVEVPGEVLELDFSAGRLAVAYGTDALILEVPEQLWTGQ